MHTNNQKLNTFLSALGDGVLLFCAYLLATFVRFSLLSGSGPAFAIALSPRILFAALLYTGAMMCAYFLFGIYKNLRLKSFGAQCGTLMLVNLLGLLIVAALFFLLRIIDFSRLVLGLFYCFSCAGQIARRAITRTVRRRLRAQGIGLKHFLLVGGGALARQYLNSVANNPYYGFVIDGYLAAAPAEEFPVPFLGGYDRMESLLDGPGIDEVVLALDAERAGDIPRLIHACDKGGVRITLIPFFNDYMPARPTIDVIGDSRMINVRQTPFDDPLNAFIKRSLDIFGSLLLILLTSPVLLGVAVGVKLSSPGPVLFKQQRVGLDKKIFNMYKFRSMRQNAEQDTGWSTDADPRKTKFGSFIRKFSLDELPQFFNVLKGDMSLIGPRPEIPYHVEHFKNEIPLYMVRQQVRPGITGWAQVHDLRGNTDIAERIRYDIWYIENWSVALDARIVLRTVFGGKLVNTEELK